MFGLYCCDDQINLNTQSSSQWDGLLMRLHTACLPGWGMPIGELLDLEALAKVAEKLGRWSFFLTVCPLNIRGGASTLANTLAVF
ncbi:hypothetical protein MBLNU459_g7062t1 [Dothideomycetes sp. NU459]